MGHYSTSNTGSLRWFPGGSQELQPAYMRQVNAVSLLTPEEEKKWARQYAESCEALHRSLDAVPGLLFRLFNDLADNASRVRLVNYFELGSFSKTAAGKKSGDTGVNSGKEEMDEANNEDIEEEGEGNVRSIFMNKVEKVRQAGKALNKNLTSSQKLVGQKKRGAHASENHLFQDALRPLKPRALFYTSCLEELEAMEIARGGAEKLPPTIALWDDAEPDMERLRCSAEEHPEWLAALPHLRELRAKMKEAADILVERNLRLVISIALRYGSSGVPLADLVQEGNVGLLRSVERFDYRRGHCFSTYASYWIRQTITHHIMNQSRIIRMPLSTIRQIRAIRDAEQKFLNDHGRVPTDNELSELTGLSAAKIRATQKMVMQPISLQSIMGEDRTLEDTIPDTDDSVPSELANAETLRESIRRLLGLLNKREQKILSLRFGLDGEDCQTLAQISVGLGLSPERVRQIEASALQKLKAPAAAWIRETEK